MDQGELTTIFCARPRNFAWFLGAGASRTAGLPTATDIIWDLKRQYYCREENQDVSRQDLQNDAVRARIQAYMESRGFPQDQAEDEYLIYFEKIFGADKERQRRYLSAILAEERIRLSVGNRVLAALMAADLSRAVFTTNFDSVVEKALAAVAQKSISAYHLEGAGSANDALNNEEYPIYCKLHGDFRYDSLKNLRADLATQNAALSQCLINAANRFGLVICGYSGRDQSVMALLNDVLKTQNPFPHGLFWTGIKGFPVAPKTMALLEQARARGVNAQYVPIETFDALLLRLWRNVREKPTDLDRQVRRSAVTSVNIPLPANGQKKPLLRLNALPVVSLPRQCQELSFQNPKSWDDLRYAQSHTPDNTIFTKSTAVWAWGPAERIKATFGKDLVSIKPRDLPTNLDAPENLHLRGFIEKALCNALARGKPLLARRSNPSGFLIVDPHAADHSAANTLIEIVGKCWGTVPGISAPVTEEFPEPEKVTWAEAAKISIDIKGRKIWLQIDPDIWIWPKRARKLAAPFMDQRRADRYNPKHNALLDAWIRLLFGDTERNAEIAVSPYDSGTDAENPTFRVGRRTAFAKGLAA